MSDTLGVAGFTSGEAYKVGFTHPYVRVPRFFVQQTIDLGGSTEAVDYQFIVNPAFNGDRGPVSVASLRIRSQF